jgi:hypothetical protein
MSCSIPNDGVFEKAFKHRFESASCMPELVAMPRFQRPASLVGFEAISI